MPQFQPGARVTTSEPVVTVDAGVPPGPHRFQLVVVDDEGQQSAPAEQVVTVRGATG
jgi:hypothetical protein